MHCSLPSYSRTWWHTHTSTQVLLLQYYILHTTRGSSVGARVGGGQIAGSQSGSWEERQFVSWIKQTGWIRANCVMLFRLCGDSGIGLSRATLADNVMSWRITRYFTLKLSDVVVNLKSKNQFNAHNIWLMWRKNAVKKCGCHAIQSEKPSWAWAR